MGQSRTEKHVSAQSPKAMELAEEILADKVDLAVLHFRSKNYGKCLLLYNEIVRTLMSYNAADLTKARKHHQLSAKPAVGLLAHPKLPSVLDQRAATFEKLDDIENAFKDAQKIVAIDPTNCKGYLRLGKLYLRRGKTVDAYKTYQKGLYTIEKAHEKHKILVPDKLLHQLRQQYAKVNCHLKEQRKGEQIEDKNRELSSKNHSVLLEPRVSGIQRRLDEMLPLKRASSATGNPQKKLRSQKPESGSQISQSRTQDIFRRFPVEIIERIFSCLLIRTVLRCHLVCKQWYHSLTSLPRLYYNSFLLKHRISAPEYFHGLRLMKKILKSSHSQSIHTVRLWSTLNTAALNRIVDNIINDEEIRLTRLDLINRDLSIEYFLGRLDKCSWKFENFKTIRQLKLGINSSIIYQKIILAAFPNLVSLDITIIDKVLRKANKLLLPYNMENLNKISDKAEAIESQSSLESLTLINHPGLTKEILQLSPGSNTFSVVPPYFNIQFANLKKLTVVSFDFKNLETQMGSLFTHSTGLRELYFENNENLSVKSLLLILRLYSPSFKLDSLTIREKVQEQPYSMLELEEDGLSCLSDLTHLDIYGSCLSSRGLLKLLRIANGSWSLRSLNIGNSQHLCFPQDKFMTDQNVLKFAELFDASPSLTCLYLSELNLDNLSLRFLRQDLVAKTGYEYCRLKKIDLLFCHLVDGVGLMDLVNASYSQPANSSTLFLEEVVLNGLNVNKETIKLLQKRDIVKNIIIDPLKTKWKQYGVNTFVQEISV